jgi:uncharacterized protein
MIFPQLLDAILARYALPLDGIHGVSHWARVLENGRLLARSSCANTAVVQLFAVLHDAQRWDDGWDREHGRRGAELAACLRPTPLDLPDPDFDLLFAACAHHADGLTDGDITVQTCWDADRLDLFRVGIRPQPQRLCTQAAQDPSVIEWAMRRSRRREVPALVGEEWGLSLPLQVFSR